MRFLIILIVLTFPIFDMLVTMRIARWSGIPVWAWILASAAAGAWVIRNESAGFRAKTMAALHGDQPLLRGLLDSGRKVLAAVLLILPGVLSDIIGLVLLLLPINLGRHFGSKSLAIGTPFGDSIRGEYRRD